MFALATLMSASVFAQDNDAKRLPGYKTTFEGNGFWNNWFMSANFGAQSLFAENSKTLNSETQSLSCRHFL